MGKKTFELAHPPKVLWTIPHGEHINAMGLEKGKYREQLLNYLEEQRHLLRK